MNDDIEKRVLLNKDGSLSVEMKVRFRLQSEDTLRWSTHIKKSASNCCPSGDNPPGYLQQGGQSETCSDPDSCDPEAANIFAGTSLPMEADQCPCCHQRREQQQYDLWENPMHSNKHAPKPPPNSSRPAHARLRQTHSSSSSSSCHSRRVVCRRSRLSSSGGGSGLEQARVEVQEELCVMEEVCTVSRCHSSSAATAGGDCDNGDTTRPHGSTRSLDDDDVVQCERADGELVLLDRDGKRPPSVISNSSNVLQELREDQDDEEEELPPSVSQCCQCEPSPTPVSLTLQEGDGHGSRVSSCHCGAATPYSWGEVDRAACSRSKTSTVSCRSSKTKTPCPNHTTDQQDDAQDRVMSSLSRHRELLADDQSRSDQSSVCSHCAGCKGTATPRSAASQRSGRSHAATPKPDPCLPDQGDDHGSSRDERAPSQMSESSEGSAMSLRSNKSNLTSNNCTLAMSNIPAERGASAMSQASNRRIDSGSPGTSGETVTDAEADCQEGAVRVASATSHESSRSHKSGCSRGNATDVAGNRSASAMSAKSKVSTKSCISHKSTKAAEVRVDSALSCQSTTSKHTTAAEGEDEAEGVSERAASALSETVKSESSTKSRISHVSRTLAGSALLTNGTPPGNGKDEVEEEQTEETLRPISVLSAGSAKTAVSGKSTKSTRSHCSHRSKVEAPDVVAQVVEEATVAKTEVCNPDADRAASAMSAKSTASVRSSKSHKSYCNGDTEATINTELDTEAGKPAAKEVDGEWVGSASVKSAHSSRSARSHKSACVVHVTAASPAEDTVDAGVENVAERSPSALSVTTRVKSRKSQSKSSSLIGSKSAVIPAIVTGVENQSEEGLVQEDKNGLMLIRAERASSAMSATSECSERSSRSQCRKRKCRKCAKAIPTCPDTPEPPCYGETDVPIIAEADAETKESPTSDISSPTGSTVTANGLTNAGQARSNSALSGATKSARSPSPRQTPTQTPPSRASTSPAHSALSPGAVQSTTQQVLADVEGEAGTRGQSAMSARSTASAKSKCRCGASSKAQKREEERNEEKEGDTMVEEKEIESEGAASIRSTKSKRSRQNLGGTDEPLDSLESVSLVLPEEEQGDSDDRESHVNSCMNPASSTHAEGMDESTATEDAVDLLRPDHKPADIPTIETSRESVDGQKVNEQAMERSPTAVSSRSNLSVKSSRSNKSTSNSCVTAVSQKPKTEQNNESEGVKSQSSMRSPSSKGNHLEPSDNRSTSAMSAASSKGRSKTPVRASAAHGKEGIADVNTLCVKSKTPSRLRPNSAASTASSAKQNASTPGPKGHKVVKSDVRSNSGSETSARTSRSNKEPCAMRISQPAAHVENTNESTLFHSLSAADLLKETIESARPISQQSRGSDKNLSSQGGCQRIRKHKEKEEEQKKGEEGEPTPAWLPNASPNEVVSNWLQSIPADGCMFVDEDEMGDGGAGEKAVDEEEPSAREEESPQDQNGDEVVETLERRVEVDEEEEEKNGEDKETDGGREEAESAKEVESSDLGPTPPSNEVNSSDHKAMLQHTVSLSRNCHSSVAVMKVLLSPSLGRSNSLPEVSWGI